MNDQRVRWHQLDRSATVAKLHSNASCGLSHKEARLRYRREGANTLFDPKKRENTSILREIFSDPAILMLLFACLLSFFFSEVWSGILALVCIGFGLGKALRLWYVERRIHAELDQLCRPSVCVLRDGKGLRVSVREVVRGDVVLLGQGDLVPADCRILEISSDFCVLTLHPDQNGGAVRTPFPKNADRVYAFGELAHAPSFENMLYGGSEVIAGEAIAIVTEVADHTYLGAMRFFEPPQAFHAKAHGGEGRGLRPYLQAYSLFLFVLLIPATLIGLLTAEEGRGIVSLLLSLASLVAIGSFRLLWLRFSEPPILLCHRFLKDRRSECRATVKHRHIAEALANLTDVFVIGHTGISDGKAHLYRVATGRGIFSPDDERLSGVREALCEAVVLLERATHENASLGDALPPLDTLRGELTDAVGFDSEALKVRLTALSSEKNAEGEVLLDVQTKQNTYGVFFSKGVSRLKKCGFYENNGRIRYLEPTVRESLISFSENAERNACRTLTVMRQINGQWVLLAVLALREEMQKILPSVTEELERSGVRVYFCLREEDDFERGYAEAAGLSERSVSASDVRSNGGILPTFLQEYRVFFGFSASEITSAVQLLRKSGRRVAVIGARSDELSAMHAATIAIACDGEVTCEANARDREDTTPETAVLRHADLLISRACRAGGGLAILLEMLSAFRAHQTRSPVAFRFLCASQISCLAVTLLSLCFGAGLMSGAQILYIGTVSELLLLSAILSVTIPQTRLRQSNAFDDRAVLSVLKSRATWLAPLFAALFAVLFVWILKLCDVILASAATSYLFVSLILTQFTAFFLFLGREKLRCGFKSTAILLLSILLPILPLALLAMLWQGADAVLMLGGWRWMTLIALPLPSAILLVSSIFLNRTAK